MGRLLDWLFLHLDLMCYSEFCDYDMRMAKFCESVTKNVEAQLKFNRLVSERLGLHAFKNPTAKTKKGVKEDVSIA